MSTIRFIHTDYLRLARPMQGITSAPGWLQEALTDATRRATRQVIETAISENADFLLIAGSPTDTPEDLDIACAWLDEQFAVARRAGIQIAAVSDHESEAQSLRRICDVVVDRQQSLLADRTVSGDVRLTTSAKPPFNRNGLSVFFDEQRIHDDELTCHYGVICRSAPAVQDERQYIADVHTSTAGAIQSTSPDEEWNGGCLVVAADLGTRQIQTRAVDVSSIRYVTKRLAIEGQTTPGRLVEEIAMASRNLHRGLSETLLVDWVISAEVESTDHDTRSLEEKSLLESLRMDLHSGHQGVWPRSVRFSDQSSLNVSNHRSESASLLEAVAAESQYGRGDSQAISPELLCGLAALQEVA